MGKTQMYYSSTWRDIHMKEHVTFAKEMQIPKLYNENVDIVKLLPGSESKV